jgi:uncharacterized delta-60 repeat protein
MGREEKSRSRQAACVAVSVLKATLLVLVMAAVAWSALGRAGSVFGGDGRVLTRFEVHPQRSGTIEDLALGGDGRVALATAGRSVQPIQLSMLNADGSPDRSFGADGLLRPQLERGRPFLDEPVRVALTGRGRNLSLLVAGTVETRPGETAVEIRRYLSDGRRATRFGRHGVAESPGKEAVALVAAPGGGFVLFANGKPGPYSYRGGLVSRFGPDGALLGTGPSKRVAPFRRIAGGTSGELVAEVGWRRSRESGILQLDAHGRVVGRALAPMGARSGFRLVGQDAAGRALGWFDGGLVRLSSDNRTVDTDFQGEPPPCGESGRPARPKQLLAEPSGAILLLSRCGLARLGTDGSADSSFARGGYLSAAADSARLALGPVGTVLFARWHGARALPTIARARHDGALDRRFGAGGRVRLRLPAPRASEATALIAVGGRLLAAGTVACGSACERFALARYSARTGRLDRSFGRGGKALGAAGKGSARAVAVAPDGDFVVAGTTPEGGIPPDHDRAFTLERFDSSGRRDPRFGKRGVVVEQLAQGEGGSQANAVAVQDDGKIVVAGFSACRAAGICFTMARFLPGGSLDKSFAHAGIFRLDGGLQAADLALDGGGRIVATGGEGGYFVTIRLTRQGRLDPSFGDGGIVVHRQRVRFKGLLDYSIGARALTLDRDGSVTVAGGSSGKLSQAVFERYLSDGRRDRGFGHRGRLLIQHFSATGLAGTRCGFVAAGTMRFHSRERQMAATGIGRNGEVQARPHPLLPTDRLSDGAAITLAAGRAIVAGSRRPYTFSSEFALAAKPLSALLPRC